MKPLSALLVVCFLAAAGCSRDSTPAPSASSKVDAAVVADVMANVKKQMAADGRLSVADVFALPDDRLVEQLWQRLEAKEARQPLSRQELAIVCVMNLDAEINNGGFDQFFFNASGDHANETHQALLDVGLPAIAEVYDPALAAFPGTPASDIGARRLQMHGLPEATAKTWTHADSTYLKATRDVDINATVARFAKANVKTIAP